MAIQVATVEWTEEDERQFQAEHEAWLEEQFPGYHNMTQEQVQQVAADYEFSCGSYNHPWA